MITQATSRQVEPDITVVTITGRLNLGNTLMSLENDLRKQIQNGARKIAFDLTGLDYIDSAGIGMLVGISRAGGAGGGTSQDRRGKRVSSACLLSRAHGPHHAAR